MNWGFNEAYIYENVFFAFLHNKDVERNIMYILVIDK